MKHVHRWIQQTQISAENVLQGLRRLGWQMYNQLCNPYIQAGILSRKSEPTDGRSAYLQQIVSPSLVTEVIISLYTSVFARKLGAYKTLEKIRHFSWLGFKTDVKHHLRQCKKCPKPSAPSQKHRHSLGDRKIIYPFHHEGLDFWGPFVYFQRVPLHVIGW